MTGRPFVLWLDPGKTTGVAWYDIESDRFGSSEHGSDELADVLDALTTAHRDRMAIGWELYIQTPRPRPGSKATYSLGEIAKLKALCTEHGIPALKGQPSSARNFQSTVVFLRRLGWYKPGLGHANDAASHLFRHLIRMHPVPENIRRRLPSGY